MSDQPEQTPAQPEQQAAEQQPATAEPTPEQPAPQQQEPAVQEAASVPSAAPAAADDATPAPQQAAPAPAPAAAQAQPANTRLASGKTEFVWSKLSDREGDFWTPVGQHNGDPDYSFSEKTETNGDKVFVHVTTKGKVQQLPDWSDIAEPEPLGACITIFASGTVTAYRLTEVTTQPASGGGGAAATPGDGNAAAAATSTTPGEAQQSKIAVYAPSQMIPDPPLEYCWAPKLDRLKGKYFFVNCENRSKAWCLPEVTDIQSRVRAFFRRYAPAKEATIPDLLKEYEGRHDELIKKLSDEYGDEPTVLEARARERLVAIFAKFDRAKLDDLETLLADNIGKEEALILSLLKQYGAEGNEPPTYRQRMTALYEKYAPDKVPTVDETLKVYHGKELQFIVALVRKLGPEPLMPCKPDKTSEEVAQFKTRAHRMYQKYCQSRLTTVDTTMETYKGLEELMVETLVRKYGPEPKANEELPPIDDTLLQQPESPNFSQQNQAVAVGADGVPLPQSGQPVRVVPLDHAAAVQGGGGGGGDYSAASPNRGLVNDQFQQQQQQSALAMLTSMEENLRGAYARLEKEHERAEMLRNENLRLHEYSNKVMQDNDVITQELRRQLSNIQHECETVRHTCDQEKEKLQHEHAAAAAVSTRSLQQELLKAEQAKLEHQKILSELNSKLCEAEEQKSETTVQTQYLRQRCAQLEHDIQGAQKQVADLNNRLKEKQEVYHRGIQTGGDDLELRTELKSRRATAQRELETLGADAQHWRSLATRLESELRAAERRREDVDRNSAEELNRAATALAETRDLNMSLEDRVACLEAELLATPSAGGGSIIGEHDLRHQINELQRALADAQATIRGQRKQVNDLRGLLAMHMAQSPPNPKSAAVLSPSASSSSARRTPGSAARK